MTGGGGGYGAAIGGLLHATGTFFQGRAADMARKRYEKAINLAPLDVSGITGAALSDIEKFLPQSSEIARRINAANQAQIQASEEIALPGAGDARQTALNRILTLFSDDQNWLNSVMRRGAALGIGTGTGGSVGAQFGTLRLSDREAASRTQLGTGLLANLLGTLRIANSPGVQAFLSPLPDQLIGIRANERAAKQALLANHALMPGMTGTFGTALQQVGAAMAGAGTAASIQPPPQQQLPQQQPEMQGPPASARYTGDYTQGSWWKKALHLYQGGGPGPG